MAADSRIDDLRRRVQKDPASIAFAQLAEECRRAARFDEAVEVCRAGLAIHPAYLSARVTLGRALIELNSLDDAQFELEFVLKSASENLAAIRGLAEIHHRRGTLPEALAQYRAALALARNDPDLQQTVADLERTVEPPKPLPSGDGLSFEQAESEFLKNLPPPPPRPAGPVAEPESVSEDEAAPKGPPDVLEVRGDEAAIEELPDTLETPAPDDAADLKGPLYTLEAGDEGPAIEAPPDTLDAPDSEAAFDGPSYLLESPEPGEIVLAGSFDGDRGQASRTIAALEQWLDAIHVARTQPGA